MLSQLFRLCLFLTTLGGLILQPLIADYTSAQAKIIMKGYETPSQGRGKTRTGKGDDVWDDKVYTPRRVPGPRPPVPRPAPRPVPLLTLEWRLLKCNTGGALQEISPLATFKSGDRFRLAVKVNQPGYLYMLNLTEGADGSILYGPVQIFPDSRIMNGQNATQKNQEIVLPAACAPSTDPCDCVWGFNETAGRETFMIIFSRQQLLDLAYNKTSNGLIKQSYIEQLKAKFRSRIDRQEIKRTSKPDSIAQSGSAGRYAFWVTNYNRKNNEELIEIIYLTNAGRLSTD
jgi:hypothetical protein